MIIDKILDEYKSYLQKYKSKRTAETYFYFANDFIKFLNKKGKSVFFEPYDVEEYIEYLSTVKRKKIGRESYRIVEEKRNDKLSMYTENTVKYATLSFIKFMASKGYQHFKEMMRDIRDEVYDVFKVRSRDVVVKTKAFALSIGEVKKLLRIFEDKPEFYSGIVLLFWSGARSGELTEKLYFALRDEAGYVDFKRQKFKIENEKWREDEHRFRVLPWCDEIDEEVKMWCRFLKEKRKTWKEEHFRRLLDVIIRQRRVTIENALGFAVSPKFARYTVETELRKVLPQHYVNYWLGHKIPKVIVEGMEMRIGGMSVMATVYADPEKTCEYLREELIEKRKHYMFDVFD